MTSSPFRVFIFHAKSVNGLNAKQSFHYANQIYDIQCVFEL